MVRISTGSDPLDTLLEGGYETDIITTVYGPSGSGKTNIALLAALAVAKSGKKVIFIDTEGGVSVERARQIARDADDLLTHIFFLAPTTFEEQKKSIQKLKDMANDKIGLIVIDSAVMLYRLELGKAEQIFEINRELGAQLGLLTQITRSRNIPVILTNQVYNSFEEEGKVNIVGGDVIKYSSKCLVELQITPSGMRRAILRKHRSIAEEREVTFKIVHTGLEMVRESKGFGLF